MTGFKAWLSTRLRRLCAYFATTYRAPTPAEQQLHTRIIDLLHERAERDRRLQSLRSDSETLRSPKKVLAREVDLLTAVNRRDLLRVKPEVTGAGVVDADPSFTLSTRSVRSSRPSPGWRR